MIESNMFHVYSKCGPRLSTEAAEKLKNRYVLMRNSAGEYERETGKKVSIPITVRSVDYVIIDQNLSCLMTKPTKWHVHPVKTQISLGIHPV